MADNAPGAENSPFDITKIRQLVKLMRENELSEVDLRFENARIRLRRGPEGIVTTTGGFGPQIVVPAPVAAPAPTGAQPESTAPAPAASVNEQTINSPIVGTFYTASSPDAEPFTAVGNKVNAKTIVCIVEAMKVFNEIQAGISGTIVACLVENGSPVEYGQPLFRVRPD